MTTSPLPAGLDLSFDAVDLIHKPGAHREVHRTITAEEQVGNPIMGVKPGTEITLRAHLESVVEGIFVSGTADSTISGECSRCLDEISDEVSVRIGDLFTYPEKIPADMDPEEAEDIPLMEGDTVDLGHMVHDAFAVAAPFRPLCSEDCLGLCDQCGFRMEDDPEHEHVVIDPRFAALADFFPKEK